MNKVIIPAALCAAALLFSACEKKGPMESAGEKVDETVRTIKNGGEKTTGDKISDAAEDVKHGAEKAADEVKK
jgi:predicted small lipoprotein YifL